jgi:hypothetical protein
LIWLAWRQFRLQVATAAVIVAGFGVLVAVAGPQLAHWYNTSPVGSCYGGPHVCHAKATDFLNALYNGQYWLLELLGITIILLAPAVVGIFWGAPLLAGEFEAGTYYLAWTQSITRPRWLLVKLTLTGLAAMSATEALSLMQAWWTTPISLAVARGGSGSPMAMNQFNPLVFATQGITPLGYAAFAFALGVTVGVLVRRSVRAMALTLAIFAVLQVAMPLWVRPHLIAPAHTTTTVSSWSSVGLTLFRDGGFFLTVDGFNEPEAWLVKTTGPVDTAGEPLTTFPADCRPGVQAAFGPGDEIAMQKCLDAHGVRIAVTYQPAERYWAFQWIETAIYLGLALALLGYCFWRIRRSLS